MYTHIHIYIERERDSSVIKSVAAWMNEHTYRSKQRL